jgi:hypothetical protein
MKTITPAKPSAPTAATEERWRHSALRKRLILGAWLEDLELELSRHLPADRRESWGPADLSSNPFEQITRQLSVLYHEMPTVTHMDESIDALIGRNGLATMAGLWPLMQRTQQMVLGMREAVIRIDIRPQIENSIISSGLQYRLVTSDYVYMESHPDQPDVPIYYVEYRLREYEGEECWIADCLDIRDPNNPTFRMKKINSGGEIGIDVTEYYLDSSADGADYPYRDSRGIPFLPITLYHAEKTGNLWDPYNGSQMVYGSLTSAVLYSMWVHLVRDACWAQKYVAGLSVAGLNQMDQDQVARRSAVSTDPSSILVFSQDPEANGQPLVGTFNVPVEPANLLESIAKYETRVALAAGLSPADISKTSGDPRSGFALAVSKSGQRESQKKFAPVFRMGDEELLAKSAMLSNRFLGTNLPESGYRVQYHAIPLTPTEMKAQRDDIIGKMDAGLMSPVQAIMEMYDDMDKLEAQKMLIEIRRERAEYT